MTADNLGQSIGLHARDYPRLHSWEYLFQYHLSQLGEQFDRQHHHTDVHQDCLVEARLVTSDASINNRLGSPE